MAHAPQRGTRFPGPPSGNPEPRLLIRLEPRLHAFLSSAGVVFSFKKPPRPAWELEFSTPNGWRDVLLPAPKPWAGILESAVFHALIIATVWSATGAWLDHQSRLERNFFRNTTLTYYHVSPYLPAVEPADNQRAATARKGDPLPARQRIRSAPRLPENRRQTIVTPPRLKLDGDVPLPNLVAWSASPGPVPVAGAVHPKLTLPSLPATVIAPPADAARHLSKAAVVPRAEPLAPAPDASGLRADVRAGWPPAPVVVAPPVSTEVAHPLTKVAIAALEPTVSAPKLPVPPPPALAGVSRSLAGKGADGRGVVEPMPAAPPMDSAAARELALAAPTGQIIALGLDPETPEGAISIPEGNRRGTFAVGPEGRAGAAGIPEAAGGGTADNGINGRDKGAEGIAIGHSGPVPAGVPVVAGNPAVSRAKFESLPNLMAMVRPTLRALPRRAAPGPHDNIPAEEAAVFGQKRFYSMMLNMPNLNSASGTCIIRFAELKEGAARGELTAPVVTEKVDPAYPAELMRDHVEGTVTLYAVIRSDGSVGAVRVLSGIDDRLDRYAREALAQWRFRPATRNGSAVDLEAVIRIPFLTRKPGL